jgi:5,10-methylenetetrahydrofolate reductase
MNKKTPTDVSMQLAENLSDLKNKIVKESDIEIIIAQTGINDKLKIERMLLECRNDVSSTILKLMSFQEKQKKVREPTVFDQIRDILNEKDAIYHDVMTKNAQQ